MTVRRSRRCGEALARLDARARAGRGRAEPARRRRRRVVAVVVAVLVFVGRTVCQRTQSERRRRLGGRPLYATSRPSRPPRRPRRPRWRARDRPTGSRARARGPLLDPLGEPPARPFRAPCVRRPARARTEGLGGRGDRRVGSAAAGTRGTPRERGRESASAPAAAPCDCRARIVMSRRAPQSRSAFSLGVWRVRLGRGPRRRRVAREHRARQRRAGHARLGERVQRSVRDDCSERAESGRPARASARTVNRRPPSSASSPHRLRIARDTSPFDGSACRNSRKRECRADHAHLRALVFGRAAAHSAAADKSARRLSPRRFANRHAGGAIVRGARRRAHARSSANVDRARAHEAARVARLEPDSCDRGPTTRTDSRCRERFLAPALEPSASSAGEGGRKDATPRVRARALQKPYLAPSRARGRRRPTRNGRRRRRSSRSPRARCRPARRARVDRMQLRTAAAHAPATVEVRGASRGALGGALGGGEHVLHERRRETRRGLVPERARRRAVRCGVVVEARLSSARRIASPPGGSPPRLDAARRRDLAVAGRRSRRGRSRRTRGELGQPREQRGGAAADVALLEANWISSLTSVAGVTANSTAAARLANAAASADLPEPLGPTSSAVQRSATQRASGSSSRRRPTATPPSAAPRTVTHTAAASAGSRRQRGSATLFHRWTWSRRASTSGSGVSSRASARSASAPERARAPLEDRAAVGGRAHVARRACRRARRRASASRARGGVVSSAQRKTSRRLNSNGPPTRPSVARVARRARARAGRSTRSSARAPTRRARAPSAALRGRRAGACGKTRARRWRAGRRPRATRRRPCAKRPRSERARGPCGRRAAARGFWVAKTRRARGPP